ncbi:MAG: flagellar basal body-associated FliL family protein [Bacillota bacterium]
MADNEGVNIKVYILMGILMIIIAAGTSFMFMTYYSSAGNKEEKKQEEIGESHNLGEFVVNLSLDSSYKYLKADIVVSTDGEEVIKEIEKRDPQVRDTIISVLRQQSLEEIREPEVAEIKQQIKTGLNQMLHNGEIKEVWFTQLVVQ